MLAFLLLGACGCLGSADVPRQFAYAAQMASRDVVAEMPNSATAVMTESGGDKASTDRFAMGARGRMIVIGPPATSSGSEVIRSSDGLFYVTAIVNGVPIRFLVDTGASMIVLRPEDARRAGVQMKEDAFRHTADTAGGKTAMAKVMLDEVIVGGTTQRALNAAVVRHDMPVSLLGQNWVAQLASLTISGDRMLFN